jgi:prepilin peptidase CpaA
MVGFVALFMLAAAALDLRTRRLPNWLTVPAFAAGLVFHTATGGWAGLGLSLGGFATGFGILLVLWLIGGGGGGDVKLMGALGAWLGPLPILGVFFGSALLAMVGMLLLLVITLSQEGYSRARKQYVVRRTGGGTAAIAGVASAGDPALAAKRARARAMPYAVPVALATLLALVWHVLSHAV